MECQQCREAVSAHLDGERADAPREGVEYHLARCLPCHAFAASAERIGRLVRVRAAEPVPDLAGAVLATLGLAEPAAEAEPPDPVRPDPVRPGLVSVGGCCGPGDGAPVTVPVVVSASAGVSGAGSCGCAATCGCGCQQGAPCRCGQQVA
ncbi:zf-HC2 domain-containing protein [Pseudonocardia nantongensis]|uniref:zf-HC2 domain-containing protein n=1 Tax=Pseudonocardia nantongensis TaxID=1181885 RepID=UPI00397C5637